MSMGRKNRKNEASEQEQWGICTAAKSVTQFAWKKIFSGRPTK